LPLQYKGGKCDINVTPAIVKLKLTQLHECIHQTVKHSSISEAGHHYYVIVS